MLFGVVDGLVMRGYLGFGVDGICLWYANGEVMCVVWSTTMRIEMGMACPEPIGIIPRRRSELAGVRLVK